MGRAEIKNGEDNGKYSILVKYSRDVLDQAIEILDKEISELEEKIAGMEDGHDKTIATLQKACLQKRKDFLDRNIPRDFEVNAWCADFTEDLTGEVGTIEVLGEIGRKEEIVIRPGYNGEAVHDVRRDGQMLPGIGATPEQFYYNLAMLPGWQKWYPLYRFAKITSIDKVNHTANVTLESAFSSQQNLDVNKVDKLKDVRINYMECHSAIFEVGDNVIIEFKYQDWESPRIIGFREKPKKCDGPILIAFHIKASANYNTNQYFVWDATNNTLKIPLGTRDDMIFHGYSFSWNPYSGDATVYIYNEDRTEKRPTPVKKVNDLFEIRSEYRKGCEQYTGYWYEYPGAELELSFVGEGTIIKNDEEEIISIDYSDVYPLPYPDSDEYPTMTYHYSDNESHAVNIGRWVGLIPWGGLSEESPYEYMFLNAMNQARDPDDELYIAGTSWASLEIICAYNNSYKNTFLYEVTKEDDGQSITIYMPLKYTRDIDLTSGLFIPDRCTYRKALGVYTISGDVIVQIYISQDVITESLSDPGTLEIDVASHVKLRNPDEDGKLSEYNPFNVLDNALLSTYIKELMEKFFENNNLSGCVAELSARLEIAIFKDYGG